MIKNISQHDWTQFLSPIPNYQIYLASCTTIQPQVTAFFASLPLARVNAKISPSETIKLWGSMAVAGTLEFQDGKPITDMKVVEGLLKYAKFPHRSYLMSAGQCTALGSRYAGNVPFVLSAQKEFNNVQYSSWDFADNWISVFLEEDQCALIPYFGKDFWLSDSERIDLRSASMRIAKSKVGKTARTANQTTQFYNVADKELTSLPKLLQPMLMQTWCYGPAVRHPLAITNLLNIDAPASALVSTEVLLPSDPVPLVTVGTGIPWV
jgi:hypothetical protein